MKIYGLRPPEKCGGPENGLKLDLVNITSYVISRIIYLQLVFSCIEIYHMQSLKPSLNKHRPYNFGRLTIMVRNASHSCVQDMIFLTQYDAGHRFANYHRFTRMSNPPQGIKELHSLTDV